MSQVADALIAAFAVIALGAALNWRGAFTAEMWRGLERASYYILFPALIVRALTLSGFAGATVGLLAATLALAVIAMMAAVLVARPLLMRALALSGPQYSSLFQGVTRWHTFIALTVIAGAFGDPGIALASVAIATLVPLSNLSSVVVVAVNTGGALPGTRRLAWLLATNPFLIACAVGLALNLAGTGLWAPLDLALEIGGRGAIGVGLLVVGAGLVPAALARAGPTVLLASVLKLLVLPLLAALGADIVGLEGLAYSVALIAAAVPTAPNSFILARQLGGDAELMAAILTAQTLAAIATMPLMLWLLGM